MVVDYVSCQVLRCSSRGVPVTANPSRIMFIDCNVVADSESWRFELHIAAYACQRRPSGDCDGCDGCVVCFICVVALTPPARKADLDILFSQRRAFRMDMHETHATEHRCTASDARMWPPNRQSS
jgi:hypothetical protein